MSNNTGLYSSCGHLSTLVLQFSPAPEGFRYFASFRRDLAAVYGSKSRKVAVGSNSLFCFSAVEPVLPLIFSQERPFVHFTPIPIPGRSSAGGLSPFCRLFGKKCCRRGVFSPQRHLFRIFMHNMQKGPARSRAGPAMYSVTVPKIPSSSGYAAGPGLPSCPPLRGAAAAPCRRTGR